MAIGKAFSSRLYHMVTTVIVPSRSSGRCKSSAILHVLPFGLRSMLFCFAAESYSHSPAKATTLISFSCSCVSCCKAPCESTARAEIEPDGEGEQNGWRERTTRDGQRPVALAMHREGTAKLVPAKQTL
eukprot:1064016-Pleurochrysis_carterae.AAC.1